MNNLLNYLCEKINETKQKVKIEEKNLEKCKSIKRYDIIENNLHHYRYLLDEYVYLYQLALEEN